KCGVVAALCRSLSGGRPSPSRWLCQIPCRNRPGRGCRGPECKLGGGKDLGNRGGLPPRAVCQNGGLARVTARYGLPSCMLLDLMTSGRGTRAVLSTQARVPV